MDESKFEFFVIIAGLVTVAVVIALIGFFGNRSSAAYQHEYTERFSVCVDAGNSAADCAAAEVVRKKA